MKKYKVIVWGLGSVGRYAVKMILQKKSLELVAAIDIDPNKVGKDAGELFGFGRTGVIVSDDIEKEFAKEADVILVYVPNSESNAATVCRALKAKKNVLTTLDVYNYQDTAPELYDMVNKCALENGVTYCQQGIYPGLFNSYLPVVCASMAGKVDKIIVRGAEDDNLNNAFWVKYFRYGEAPDSFDESGTFEKFITSYYGPTVKELARRCHLEYDEYVEEHEAFTTDKVIHTKYLGDIQPGTIAYHEFRMMCKKDGEEVAGFHFVHKICHEQNPFPPMETGYEIFGEPTNLKVTINGMIDYEGEPFSTSAAPSVNLIKDVVEAEPGWVDALDLRASQPIE